LLAIGSDPRQLAAAGRSLPPNSTRRTRRRRTIVCSARLSPSSRSSRRPRDRRESARSRPWRHFSS